MATMPKASVIMFPPNASQAPIASGNRKVAVIGPEATPPESNAIAVNNFGTKNVSIKAIKYPGTKNQRILIPVNTRIIASPTDEATPIDKLVPIAFAEIAPEVISSTCFVRTNTAGSARTMK